jgi:tellurite resistance protein
VPHAAGVARALLFTGLALQTGLALLIIRTLIASAPERRSVTPIWHLSFVGFIIAGVSAAPLGFPMLGQVVLFSTIPVAVAIWGISLVQLIRRVPPPPLRPLLAIHLAPASLFGTVSAIEGYPQMAMVFAVIGGGILGALLLTARWITVSGFGPLWGAFTFPTAAYAGLLLLLGGHWAEVGGLVLVVATLTIPVIAFKVFQLWANGQLAVKTNAAVA